MGVTIAGTISWNLLLKLGKGSGNRDHYGLLVSSDTIKNGEMVLQSTFYPNGSPKDKIPYRNGLIEGQLMTYYPSGEPNTLEDWLAGMQKWNHGDLPKWREVH